METLSRPLHTRFLFYNVEFKASIFYELSNKQVLKNRIILDMNMIIDAENCTALISFNKKVFFNPYILTYYTLNDEIEGGGPVMYEFELGRAGHYFYIRAFTSFQSCHHHK